MKLLKYLLVIALLLPSLAIPTVHAQDGADVSTVTIAATGEELALPEEIASGLTQVAFENQGEAPFVPGFARLKPDTTRDMLMEALQEGPGAATPLITLLGAPMTLPQTSNEVVYILEPGTYFVLNLAATPPQFGFFEVTGDSPEDVTEPEADQSVDLLDFAFTMPLEISAGEQTWLIENNGEQWHELAIATVEEGANVSELYGNVLEAAQEAEEGFNPLQPSIFWTPMDPGQRAWVTFDLAPGTYVVHCFLPDLNTGHPHATHGMVQILSVE